MDDVQISTATHLRERAAYFRTLAQRAMSDGIAREFYMMAEEYEEDAGRITDSVQASLLRRHVAVSRWRT